MVPLIFSVLIFLAGLILGYYLWGVTRPEQVDYKAFLQETINYIATLEHKNKKLSDELNSLENELGVLQQKLQDVTPAETERIKQLSEEIQNLQRQNEELRAAISESMQVSQENQKLKERILMLEDELKALMSEESKEVPELEREPQPQATPQ
ncbi:MAG: hypothetical protein ACP5G0_10040 [Desulfomonilia bacterium]